MIANVLWLVTNRHKLSGTDTIIAIFQKKLALFLPLVHVLSFFQITQLVQLNHM